MTKSTKGNCGYCGTPRCMLCGRCMNGDCINYRGPCEKKMAKGTGTQS